MSLCSATALPRTAMVSRCETKYKLKKMQKIIIVSTIVWCIIGSATAQTRYFCYDEAGNRTTRSTTKCTSLTKPGTPPVLREGSTARPEELSALSLAQPAAVITAIAPSTTAASTQNGATLYPNPTTGISQLTFDGAYSFSYQLYDISGRLLRQGSMEGVQVHVFDITSQTSGLYVLQVQVKETGKSYTWQVMKD
jgi:Secretion system C-terminal sorting domain